MSKEKPLNLISIIHLFDVNELKTLLSAFDYSTKGNESNLRDRALYLLQNKPSNLNHQAYILHIIQMCKSMPSIRLVRAFNDQSQHIKQYMMKLPTHTTPVAVSPIIQPTIKVISIPNQGNHINQSNNIQKSSNQAGTHNTIPRQQTNEAVHIANSFVPSTQYFKKNIFCEIVAEIIKISDLLGNSMLSIENTLHGTREERFEFTLSLDQAAALRGEHQDFSYGQDKCDYQLQFKIGFFERDCTEITEYLPSKCLIRLNNSICPLPKMAPTKFETQPGSAERRIQHFINCTKFALPFKNTIVVNWVPDSKNYVVGMYLVKKLTPIMLVQKLQNKAPRSSEEIKNMIRKNAINSNPDLFNTSHFCSIICPIGQIRVKIPAKSSNCNHLNCFDAMTYILMNEKTETWKCPICNKPCLYDDLLIESYFVEVISSPKIPDNCKEIKILADGSWNVCEENKETLDISIDVEEIHNHNPSRPKRSKNMASFIDLTSNDEK